MRSTQIGRFNVWYREGTTDEDVIGQSFGNDIFFPVVPDYRPGPENITIDVGAHIGGFSLLAASLSPRGKVLALEPCEETWGILERNVAANQAAHVLPLRLALAGDRGTRMLFYDSKDGNWGHSITRDMSGGGEVVTVETLEGLMERHALPRVDLIKFNCEGAEFEVLLEAPRNVLRRIGLMIVLYHLDMVSDPAFTDTALLTKLRSCGFDCEVLYRRPARGWIVARNRRQYGTIGPILRRLRGRLKTRMARLAGR